MALTSQDRMYIEQRVSNDSKSVLVAYLLWFFLGLLSLHRFYLGRPGTAILQIFTLGGLGIWWLIDAFLIPSMIDGDRDRLRRRLEDAHAGSVAPPPDMSRWSQRDREAYGQAPRPLDTSKWSAKA